MRCIVEGSKLDIPVQDMKDGDLAVITNWDIEAEEHKGIVVQRYGDHLITLGGTTEQAWIHLPTSDDDHSMCHVRLLKVGETIKLVK